ncbi:MAG: alpha-N-acetylglucosaminidase N-terminal domain-containing protein [Bacteroidales bacterium]|nr:alpha-N-acetylglucosaminidase N-terminal domain-containing protein [Bacteroidales bacterium]
MINVKISERITIFARPTKAILNEVKNLFGQPCFFATAWAGSPSEIKQSVSLNVKKIFVFILLLLALSACRSNDEKAVCALARRVMGPQARGIVFEQVSASEDSYELRQKGNNILIRGNNANSMAVGLNRYIQEYCLADVSWYHYNPVELPSVLPPVPEPVTGKAEIPIRFFLNYCTLGYTMPWWQWEEWERFIDWMALNGVNMPLAITGEEAVWLQMGWLFLSKNWTHPGAGSLPARHGLG